VFYDGYQDHTNLIITTDDGREQGIHTWDEHGFLIKGCKQTWMALLGPNFNSSKKIDNVIQLYQKDFCKMVDTLKGTRFTQ
jgi:hypothetical protein